MVNSQVFLDLKIYFSWFSLSFLVSATVRCFYLLLLRILLSFWAFIAASITITGFLKTRCFFCKFCLCFVFLTQKMHFRNWNVLVHTKQVTFFFFFQMFTILCFFAVICQFEGIQLFSTTFFFSEPKWQGIENRNDAFCGWKYSNKIYYCYSGFSSCVYNINKTGDLSWMGSSQEICQTSHKEYLISTDKIRWNRAVTK